MKVIEATIDFAEAPVNFPELTDHLVVRVAEAPVDFIEAVIDV
jgi:hypothetical protein